MGFRNSCCQDVQRGASNFILLNRIELELDLDHALQELLAYIGDPGDGWCVRGRATVSIMLPMVSEVP